MDLPSAYQIAGIIGSVCAVVTLVIYIFGRIIKSYSENLFNRIVKDYLSELKPNGGSSLKDGIKRIEADLSDVKSDLGEVKTDLSRLEGQFTQHIIENN